jgi:hypothetical protein
MPLAALTDAGSASVSSGSYTMVRGSTRASLPVNLRSPSLSPQIAVASEPE